MNKVITLTKEDFLAKGLHKECYIHPDDKSLCIKTPYTSAGGDGKKEYEREVKFNELVLKRKNWSSILPKYYGKVCTNFGEGVVYEIVKDYDDEISKSLKDYLCTEGFLKDNFTQVAAAIRSLKSSMLDDKIITMRIVPENLLYKRQKDGSVKIMIIDDLGTPAFIPFEYYFSFAAKAKVKRKWAQFLNTLKVECEQPLIDKLINEIN